MVLQKERGGMSDRPEIKAACLKIAAAHGMSLAAWFDWTIS